MAPIGVTEIVAAATPVLDSGCPSTTTQTPVFKELTDSLAALVTMVLDDVVTVTDVPEASLTVNPVDVTSLTVPKVLGALVVPNPEPPPGAVPGGAPRDPPPGTAAAGATQEPELLGVMLTATAATLPLESGCPPTFTQSPLLMSPSDAVCVVVTLVLPVVVTVTSPLRAATVNVLPLIWLSSPVVMPRKAEALPLPPGPTVTVVVDPHAATRATPANISKRLGEMGVFI